jgi:hypothetical protein
MWYESSFARFVYAADTATGFATGVPPGVPGVPGVAPGRAGVAAASVGVAALVAVGATVGVAVGCGVAVGFDRPHPANNAPSASTTHARLTIPITRSSSFALNR